MRQKNIRTILSIGLLVAAVSGGLWLASTALPASAQTATAFSIESIGTKVGLKNTDLLQVVYNVIRWALGILTFTALGFVMYGGFLWLTAAGNEKQIEKAKRVILQALIGMVIVLIAWAIVLFVARFFRDATDTGNTNNTNSGVSCLPGSPDCPDPTSTFNVTTVATCADPSDYTTNVPRSSNVAVFFNAPVAQDSVQGAVEGSAPKLMTLRCGTDAANDPACATQDVATRPVSSQRFTANKSAATESNPGAEWVAKQRSNAITFVHRSFDTNATDAKNQLFEAERSYRIQVPRQGSATALTDATTQERPLVDCRNDDGSIIPNCQVDTDQHIIHWTFTTGEDVAGPAFGVTKTVPVSTYKYPTPVPSPAPVPDRDVDRDGALCIYFSGAVDPMSVDASSFTVTKYQATAPPTAAGNWVNGTLETSTLPTGDFTEPYFVSGGRGVCIGPKAQHEYDAFSWYRVHVDGIRNLCGTEMSPTPFEWVFESNDRLPGVEKVYPADGATNMCPATKVKVVFRTSMWNREASNCTVGVGSYVTSGRLTTGGVDAGRAFQVVDQFDPDQPNQNCRVFEFAPTTTALRLGQTYNGVVLTNRSIDSDGKKLEVGTENSGHPWSFTVGADAATCVQPPLITRISPAAGKNGQCITVQGDYFEKVNQADTNPDKADPGDGLTLGGRDQLTDADATWTNNSIVTVVDAGSLERDRKQPYKVTVHYGAPLNVDLSDEVADRFTLQSGDGSSGPCLLKLTKTSGPPGTLFNALGKRFGNGTGQSAVAYPLSPAAQELPYASWSATQVTGANIVTGTPVGEAPVSIVDAAGQISNEIQFTTTAPVVAGPGAPRVEESTLCELDPARRAIPSPNPKDGDQNVCLTVQPEVRFTMPMLDTSLTANGAVVVSDCTSGTCDVVPDTSVHVDADAKGLQIQMPRLTPSHKYSVTISGDVQSTTHAVMGADYTWRFTAQSGNGDCPIKAIGIAERNTSFSTLPFSYALHSRLYDAACRSITGACAAYDWTKTSSPNVITLSSTTSQDTIASSVDDGTIEEGVASVQVQCQEKVSPKVTITYDATSCTSDAQCQGTNRFGESCTTASHCVNSSCTPVVTKLMPDSGRAGSGVSIHGCWFGSYVDGRSKVIFGADQGELAREAPAFDPQICDNRSSWQNDYIIRAVPASSVTGSVKVIRSDTREASSGTPFTVNTVLHPILCKVLPPSAAPGTNVTMVGTGFTDKTLPDASLPVDSSNTTAQSSALIQNVDAAASLRSMTGYLRWNDKEIAAPIPSIGFGLSRVYIRANAIESNDVLFTVKDPNAAACVSCTETTSCPNAADGSVQGCSNVTKCCAPRPRVISSNPNDGETNMCRNTVTQLRFSLPLDANTATPESVRYTDGAFVRATEVSVHTDGTEGILTIQPGLLESNATQRVSLQGVAVANVADLKNASFETMQNGQVASWVNVRSKQTTDHPSGVTGKSGLADCSNCAAGEQAYLAQTIFQSNGDPWPANSMFRITGWVKVEQPANVKSGLITQCTDAADRLIDCTFDLVEAAPGLFTGTSSGWRKVTWYARTTVPAGLHLNCFARAGAKTWCDSIVVERMTDQATTLRGQNGVLVDTTTGTRSFTTSTEICTLDHVSVTPSYDHWETTNDQQTFVAEARSTNGQVIANTPAYSYTWTWKTGDAGIAKLGTGSDQISFSLRQALSGGKIGSTRVTATAAVTTNSAQPTEKPKKSGSARIVSSVCANPWQFVDSADNCDTASSPAACADFNFQIDYCRGAVGATLLPDFSYVGQDASTGIGAIEGENTSLGRKKSIFFKVDANATDAIGILIYDNTNFLTPADWFADHFPSRAGSGVFTTVGGYGAYQVGSTVYVGVTDLVGTAMRGRIFVFDYNSNQADSQTKVVYTAMLDGLMFNNNLNDDIERGQLQRDTQRRQDLSAMARLLEAYKKSKGTFPSLGSGSYVTGISTSKWPSWQATLGAALGKTLPVDPLNSFARTCSDNAAQRCTHDDQCGGGTCKAQTVCATPFESSTCWAESTHRFMFPAGSTVYGYQFSAGTYQLSAQMEYAGVGSFRNFSPRSAECESGALNDYQCYNYHYIQ